MSESEAPSAPGAPSSGGGLQLSSFGWLLTGGAFVYVVLDAQQRRPAAAVTALAAGLWETKF